MCARKNDKDTMKLYDTLTDLFADVKDRDREIRFIDGDKVEATRGDRGTAQISQVIERGRKLLVGTHLGNRQFAADAHRIPRSLKVEGKAYVISEGDVILIRFSV